MGIRVWKLQALRRRASLFRQACIWVAFLGLCLLASNAVAEEASSASTWWAFKPVTAPSPPKTHKREWIQNPVDAFILHRLETSKLQPSPPADRASLFRRLNYDLIGLPPSAAEVEAFLTDRSPEAFTRAVERLLASPRYGERWGRHWMDLVRYADTAGDNADYPVPEAHRYRDYIIDALNQDKPYDLFIQEQLAGDILASGRSHENYAEQIVATGFLALSRRYATAPFELMHLTLEDAIDTTGKAFLGLNLRCARCHDHKFDPTTQRDYYGLYGIFSSTQFPYAGSEEFQTKNLPRTGFIPLLPPQEAAKPIEANRARLEALRQELAQLDKVYAAGKTNSPARKDLELRLDRVRIELKRRERSGAMPDLPVAYAVTEGKAADETIQLRGEPDRRGESVGRCVPKFIEGGSPLKIPVGSSGRLELARWIASSENPLTARVMVNRIWQYHFGKGLVSSPSNFGRRSDPPSHPELLDYLASYFIQHGWSIKAMHRLILSSATWQQAAPTAEKSHPQQERAAKIDPSNLLYWSFDRRRLDAEAIRDTLLFVAGGLDLNRPGAHPFPPVDEWHWTQHNPFKQPFESHHRSVYLMRQRLQRHPFLALFDAPDANLSTDQRPTSTVPQQALFLMNNPFVTDQAKRFADCLLKTFPDERRRITQACEMVWGRPPSEAEILAAERFLTDFESAAQQNGQSHDAATQSAWASYSKVLMTSNEAFYAD